MRTKVRYGIAHDDEQQAIAARGRARVLAAHPCDHRVREIAGAVGLG